MLCKVSKTKVDVFRWVRLKEGAISIQWIPGLLWECFLQVQKVKWHPRIYENKTDTSHCGKEFIPVHSISVAVIYQFMSNLEACCVFPFSLSPLKKSVVQVSQFLYQADAPFSEYSIRCLGFHDTFYVWLLTKVSPCLNLKQIIVEEEV